LKLSELPVLFVDCQTTGANPQQGNLLEISWFVATAQEKKLPHQSYLVSQPEDKAVPFRIQAITGIKTEDLIGSLTAAVVRDKFQQTLTADATQRQAEPAFALAHFARFERPFLQTLLRTDAEEQLPFKLFCTFEIAKRMYPNLPSKGIRAVAGFFGTTCAELKRAESHANATLAIWQGLLPQLEALGIESAEDLTQWLVEATPPKRSKFEYPLPRDKRLELPDQPGIYRMLSRSNIVLYVGKATSLKQRVNSYFRGQTGKECKTKELLSQVYDLDVTVCSTPLEAALLETDEIKRLDPPYNRALKRRHRSLMFYSRDLASSSAIQDSLHLLGPFASSRVLEPIIKLDASLKLKTFDQKIFYHEIPQVILSEGFEIFCINEGIERETISNARSLLALGLWLYRKEMKRQQEEEKLELANLLLGLTETETDSDQLERDEPSQNTAPSSEEISQKYERLLRYIARSYLRSKVMTRILDCQVSLVHKQRAIELIISRGKIDRRQDSLDDSMSATGLSVSSSELPWQGLDLDTYDRMSVLLGELARNNEITLHIRQRKSAAVAAAL